MHGNMNVKFTNSLTKLTTAAYFLQYNLKTKDWTTEKWGFYSRRRIEEVS